MNFLKTPSYTEDGCSSFKFRKEKNICDKCKKKSCWLPKLIESCESRPKVESVDDILPEIAKMRLTLQQFVAVGYILRLMTTRNRNTIITINLPKLEKVLDAHFHDCWMDSLQDKQTSSYSDLLPNSLCTILLMFCTKSVMGT